MQNQLEIDQSYLNTLIKNGLQTAIFDIDGTISNTHIGNLYFYIKKQEKGKLSWIIWYTYFTLIRLPYFLVQDYRNRAIAQQKIYSLYSNYQQDYLNKMSEELFAKDIKNKIYQKTINIIRHLQQNGVAIVFLSTNIEPIVKQYAIHFNIAEYYAIPLHKICGRVEEPTFFALFKENAFNNIKGACNALVVADAWYDLPILNKTKNPLIVTKKIKPWMTTIKNIKYIFIDS